MTQATEQIAKQYAAAAINKQQWGSAMYNVLAEGLVGGGATDDTTALQTLVNKAIAAGRKAIFFPYGTNGTYKVTALTNADQVVFFGDHASFIGGYTGMIKQLGNGFDNPAIAAIDMGGFRITNLGAPASDSEAARLVDTKEIIDPFNAWTTNLTEPHDGHLATIGGITDSDRLFGTFGLVSAIAGAVKIPSNSTLYAHSQALAGYARTASTITGAVGGFMQGDVDESGCLAWGANIIAQDRGFSGVNLWGIEVDVNVKNVNTVARGIDITGGSTVTPGASYAINIGALGAFESPPIKWTEGISIKDGATNNAIVIGTMAQAGASGSASIKFRGRNAGGAYKEPYMQCDSDGNMSLTTAPDGIVSLKGHSTGFPVNNTLTIYGNKVSIMGAGLPAYTLDVNGDFRAAGKFAANNATPQGKQTVNAAATDAATTQALVNQLRTALINIGICQ